MKYDEDLNIPGIVVSGLLLVLLVVAAVMGLQGMYYGVTESQRQVKVVDQIPVSFKNLQYEQQTRMNSYEWVDKNNGIVNIPIEMAMELVVDDIGRGETGVINSAGSAAVAGVSGEQEETIAEPVMDSGQEAQGAGE